MVETFLASVFVRLRPVDTFVAFAACFAPNVTLESNIAKQSRLVLIVTILLGTGLRGLVHSARWLVLRLHAWILQCTTRFTLKKHEKKSTVFLQIEIPQKTTWKSWGLE